MRSFKANSNQPARPKLKKKKKRKRKFLNLFQIRRLKEEKKKKKKVSSATFLVLDSQRDYKRNNRLHPKTQKKNK